jgi:hypothetical protein
VADALKQPEVQEKIVSFGLVPNYAPARNSPRCRPPT